MYEISCVQLVAIALVITYVINYLFKFYSNFKRYPRGPTPIPVFGNLLMLRKHLNRNPVYFFNKLPETYGELYTFWIGPKAAIFINNCDIAKEMYNKTEFCDRLDKRLQLICSQCLVNSDKISLSLMDYNEESKILRKICKISTRNVMMTDKLHEYTNKIVDETVITILRNEFGKPFDPSNYLDSIFVRLITRISFGKEFLINDKEVELIIKSLEMLPIDSMKILLRDYIPLLKLFVKQPKTPNPLIVSTTKLFTKYFYDCVNSDCESSECFSKSLISNRNKLLEENKDLSHVLSDSNLIVTAITLFHGSNDTTHYMFKWILLLMVYYPEWQQKMRDEINKYKETNNSESIDSDKCDLVNAFICETLRFRSVLPYSVMHTTSRDESFNGYSIPKGTLLLLNLWFILNDPKYWLNPHVFNPQRFLDSDNHFILEKSNFIPFGVGKRICIGNKIAMKILFLVLTRFLLKTSGYKLGLSDKHDSVLEPKKFGFFIEPNKFDILITKE